MGEGQNQNRGARGTCVWVRPSASPALPQPAPLHPERLAWCWALRVSEWECQCLGSLGAFQSQGLGVSLRGHCRGGLWKAWSGEDIDVWGCEGLPRHGWTWGLGTETQGDPHRAVVPTVLSSLGHPVRKQGGKGSLSGMQFEYLEPNTMKILERKFSDKSEANKTKAIIRYLCLQRGTWQGNF